MFSLKKARKHRKHVDSHSLASIMVRVTDCTFRGVRPGLKKGKASSARRGIRKGREASSALGDLLDL